MTLELLKDIFSVCIVPLLGVLTAYLVKFITVEAEKLAASVDNELASKYINMAKETVNTCVIMTNQTYVDALKDKNAFDEEAQKEAFRLTFETVNNILSEEAKKYLTEAFGDLNAFMTCQIEASVKLNK